MAKMFYINDSTFEIKEANDLNKDQKDNAQWVQLRSRTLNYVGIGAVITVDTLCTNDNGIQNNAMMTIYKKSETAEDYDTLTMLYNKLNGVISKKKFLQWLEQNLHDMGKVQEVDGRYIKIIE